MDEPASKRFCGSVTPPPPPNLSMSCLQICEICNLVFMDENALEKHNLTPNHQNASNGLKPTFGKYFCFLCWNGFLTKEELTIHCFRELHEKQVLEHQVKSNWMSTTNFANESENGVEKNNGENSCEQCQLEFNSKTFLEMHKKSYTHRQVVLGNFRPEKYNCFVCLKSYFCENDWLEHCQADPLHSKMLVWCGVKNAADEEYEIVDSEEEFFDDFKPLSDDDEENLKIDDTKCQDCLLEFTSFKYKKLHLNSYSHNQVILGLFKADDQFNCYICLKGFITKDEWIDHCKEDYHQEFSRIVGVKSETINNEIVEENIGSPVASSISLSSPEKREIDFEAAALSPPESSSLELSDMPEIESPEQIDLESFEDTAKVDNFDENHEVIENCDNEIFKKEKSDNDLELENVSSPENYQSPTRESDLDEISLSSLEDRRCSILEEILENVDSPEEFNEEVEDDSNHDEEFVIIDSIGEE